MIHKAMDLIQAHPLRAYDAVQLASALTLAMLPHGMTLTFVSADEALLAVAQRRGLSTVNPSLSP
ncbi:MAG: type II toxin-antitoxin system VapC family toxin [Candidatus Methylomirabilia bacterium]